MVCNCNCTLVAIFLALFSWIAYKIFKSGLFRKAEVTTTDKPVFLDKSLVVYYKHQIGHYKHSAKLMEEARSLLPSGATAFGVYYDDPDEVAEHLLQSAAGVVFAVDGENQFSENYAEQLTRWGFERMVLPAVSRAVQAKQPFTGFLSLIALVNTTYAAIKNYIKENRLETTVVLEFYANDTVTVILPLDHEKEFFVPEHISTEQLESKLAKKKFDSDESDSESEPDPDEEGEEAEVEQKGTEEKTEEQKKDE